MEKSRNQITYFLIVSLLLITGCSIRESQKIDINGMKISRGLINDITEDMGNTYELFIRYNWVQDPVDDIDGQRTDTIRNGVVYREIIEDKAVTLFNLYKARLKADKKYLFLSKSIYTRSGNLSYDMVLLEANNQFQALKILNTNGLKEGIGHQEIFDFLVQLHQSNPLEIYLIDENRISMQLKNALDEKALTQIQKLCPQHEYFQNELKLIWDN